MDQTNKNEQVEARPRDAVDCKRCKGRPPRRNQAKCSACGGRGWLRQAELEALKTKGGEA